MRKVTTEIVSAFMRGNKLVRGNSMTDGRTLYLHGHAIARHTDNGGIEVSNAGWPTVTTRERLNGIPGVSATQHKHEQYLNGKPWDGAWTRV
jgi:hypothetical protein